MLRVGGKKATFDDDELAFVWGRALSHAFGVLVLSEVVAPTTSIGGGGRGACGLQGRVAFGPQKEVFEATNAGLVRDEFARRG